MFYVKLSESTASRRRVPILMVDETDGNTPLTGLTLSGLVSKNGGTFAGVAGSFAEAGYGQYYYQFSTGEIDTLGWTGLHVTATGARNYDAIIHVTAYDAYSGSFIAPTDVWNADISSITSAGTAGSQLNLVASGGAGITSGDVWNYDISGITGAGTAGSQVNAAATGGAGITAGDVWEYDISGIVTAGTSGSQLNTAASVIGGSLTAADVWDYSGLTVVASVKETIENTYINTANIPSPDTIRDYVWNAQLNESAGFSTSPPYASGLMYQAGNAITTVPSDVWNYDISAISGAGLAGTQLNLAAAPGAGGGITAGDVWNYQGPTEAASVKETLESANTNSANASSQTGAASIRDAVWDTDVSYLTSPQAGFALYQAASGTTLNAPSEVWSYVTREITGGTATTVTNAVLVDPASMTGIAGTVWSTDVSAFTNPSAGYDLTQAASAIGITAGDVWSYATREITGGLANTVTTVTNPVEVSTAAMAGVANTVWSTDISGYTTAGTAGSQLNLAAAPSGAGITAGDVSNAVWDVPVASYTTNGTFGLNILRSDVAGTAGTVSLWTGGAYSGIYADTYRIDASYDAAIALKDILTGIGASITGNITGNLSGSVGSVTSDVPVDEAAISADVWSYVSRTLTSGSGISAYDVWNFDPTAMTVPQAGAILTDIQTDTNQIQTDISNVPNNVWSSDISGYSTPGEAGFELSQAAAGSGITAGDVWSYTTRTITGGIADTVTTVVDGVTVTTNNDKTGYELSGTQAFNLTGNITGNLSGSVGSVTADVNVDESAISADVWSYVTRTLTSGGGVTAGDVWSYATRTTTGGVVDTNNDKTGYSLSSTQTFDVTGNITGNISGSVGSVTNPVDITTNAMSGTAGSVWNYVTRTLTSGSGLTAGDVWTYATRDITGGTVDNVTNDVNISTSSMSGIANTVWSTDVSGFTSPSAGFDLTNASAGGGITAGAIAAAVWNAQVATYATAGSNETLGTDTYGQKIARTVNINRPISINTANAVVVGSMSNGAITATAIASNAITEAKFATDALTSRIIAADAITSAELAPSANTEIADAVWAYATRNITGGTITTVDDKTGYSLSGSQTFDVTGNITGDLSGSVGSVTTVSNGAISASSFLAGAIDAAAVASDAVTEIANGVWSVGTRTITGGTITTVSDKTGYSLSGTQSFNLTGNITGNLSGSVGSVSGAVGSVTGAVGSVTGAVGSVTSPVSISTTSMVGIAGTVWSTDISSYPNPSAGYSLAVAGSGGVSAADVWQYATRGLTEDVNVSTTSMSGIANTVWSVGTRTITGGIVTSVGDKTGYSLSSTQTFDLTGNITGSVSGSVGSVTGSVGSVVNPVLVATASMSGIAGTVWTYTPRTLTSGAGATAGDIWTYNISGIATTGTAGATLNSAAVAGSVVTVVNGPYRLTSTAEGVDGRIDILADSVQTIQLSCLDGLGAPFNIGGYTSLVNVYDVSGALAATYTPTVDFAQNGILSFEIDADITGVTGRYTLVVELTAGAEVIQLGPLEILVRPL